ncbi:hypothetical protein [Imtechella halotolerans]|uniref:Lipoprotein n=1 Tax=Imtechella halotolerans K1 TaxID=946077 RepID=I0WBY8_9FLAO|nr:hypothetical protein [Imtechella halotolerans]EID73904.1 hypothetical protein W5A_10075 [Imtechella halotolerans K1]WMQ64113.1 hypothetical protein PT603_03860 [Imtechella halotolerans]
MRILNGKQVILLLLLLVATSCGSRYYCAQFGCDVAYYSPTTGWHNNKCIDGDCDWAKEQSRRFLSRKKSGNFKLTSPKGYTYNFYVYCNRKK